MAINIYVTGKKNDLFDIALDSGLEVAGIKFVNRFNINDGIKKVIASAMELPLEEVLDGEAETEIDWDDMSPYMYFQCLTAPGKEQLLESIGVKENVAGTIKLIDLNPSYGIALLYSHGFTPKKGQRSKVAYNTLVTAMDTMFKAMMGRAIHAKMIVKRLRCGLDRDRYPVCVIDGLSSVEEVQYVAEKDPYSFVMLLRDQLITPKENKVVLIPEAVMASEEKLTIALNGLGYVIKNLSDKAE